MSVRRSLLAGTAVLLASTALTAAPTSAHDPDVAGDQATSGAAGPDVRSRNMELVQNLPAKPDDIQSDIAFQGRYAYAGGFLGFRVIDVSDPENAKEVAYVECNGGQGDISVWEDLLFSSVDAPQSSSACDSTNVTTTTPGAWEGIRIFDISNPRKPKLVNAVRTDCGSHTHTLLPGKHDQLYIYVSSYAATAASIGPDCEQLHGKISVIRVHEERPQTARVVAEPVVDDLSVFDTDRLEFDELGLPPGFLAESTKGCHDISVLVPRKLAAAACLSEGQLWDISDPTNPVTIERLTTPQVRTWHSAAFTWDGKRVAFGDEWGGGVLPRCRPGDSLESGAVWFYDVATGDALGHFKVPRTLETTCTMHNFNFVPGVDRDILVSSAYTAGTTVVDVTNPAKPREIAFYQAGDPPADTWSSYWHNGFVHATDIVRGVDVFEVEHRFLRGAATLYRNNPQTQTRLFR